jgi:hypothetical protein
MNTLKAITLVTITGITLTACNTQTYYQKHNMLNNKQPCPQGTQADEYGMKCEKIVKEIIPENETKLQKFNRFLGKVDKGIKESEVFKEQPDRGKPKVNDCISCDDDVTQYMFKK